MSTPINVVKGGTTTIYFNPDYLEIPYLVLDKSGSTLVEIELYISNVKDLQRFYFKLAYDMSVLEYVGYQVSSNFGWTGRASNPFDGTLARPFTGSGLWFKFYLKVVGTGESKITLIDVSLWNSKDEPIPCNISAANVTVITLEEWVDGELETLKNKYDSLLSSYLSLNESHIKLSNDYNRLSTNYSALNDSYYSLKNAYDALSTNYTSLVYNYTAIKSDYEELNGKYDVLSLSYDKLCKDLAEVKTQLTTNTILMYTLFAITLALLALTSYFARKRPKAS